MACRTKYVVLAAVLIMGIYDDVFAEHPEPTVDLVSAVVFKPEPAPKPASAAKHAVVAKPLKALKNGLVAANPEPVVTSVSPDRNCHDNCGENFWIRGDLLYLSICEGTFGCAFGPGSLTTTVSDGQIVAEIGEKDEDIDFDWNLGFRVGAGFNFPSCWSPGVYWTHLNSNGDGHDGKNQAHWKLNFNEVDALTSYQLKYGRRFGLKPFAGARYANIYQKLHANFEATVITLATGETSIEMFAKKDRERFWGAGPLLGFEGDFCFGRNLSFYGNLAGNFLYGKFKNKFHDIDIHMATDSCGVLTGFDAGFGFRVNAKHLTLQLGWEHHAYFDFNQIGCDGDLNLYGLNASATIRF